MHTLLAAFLLATAAVPEPPKELRPQLVTLAEKEYEVAQVLSAIREQTGNDALVDRRSAGANRKLTIGLARLSFWEAVDRVAEKLKARVSPFSAEGVALIDGPGRAGKLAYSGICRAEIHTIDVRLDVATGQRTCSVEMEIAWEPRFEPLYLWLDEVTGSYGADAAGKILDFKRNSRVLQTATRGAARLDVILDGPERSVGKIDKLDAHVGFLGPTRMLTFTLPAAAKAAKKSPDGIEIEIAELKQTAKRWTIDVLIRNPEATPEFESYQSWLGNNRIRLVKTVEGKDDIVWSPKPEDEQIEQLTARRARVRYGFDGAKNRGEPGDWKLVVRTPGPIVEFGAPFAFRDVPLP